MQCFGDLGNLELNICLNMYVLNLLIIIKETSKHRYKLTNITRFCIIRVISVKFAINFK